MKKHYPLILCILSYMIPMVLITISIVLSPWFSIWENALSDLGHATRSSVSPLFNLSLAIGGFLISINSTYYLSRVSWRRALVLTYTGFSLIMIGLFDVIYGLIHFIVSVMFFVGLIAYLIFYTIDYKTLKPLIAVLLQIITWLLYFISKTPPGAAIPEIVAVSLTIPFYTNDFVNLYKRLV